MILKPGPAQRRQDHRPPQSEDDDMIVNDETRTDSAPPVVRCWHPFAHYLSAGLLLCFGLVMGYFVYHGSSPSNARYDDSEEQGGGLPPANGPAVPNYRTWKEPSLAIVISGQMHGYF